MLPGGHFEELRALYAEVDALLSPYSCEGTTECCRFGITGREPYPTAVELGELQRAIVEAGITLGGGRRRRPLPLADGGRGMSREGERPCPLLGEDGRCRVYMSRPFGCRTYFCHRVSGPGKLPRREVQHISRKIADLSARYAPRDPHPRPLTRALGR